MGHELLAESEGEKPRDVGCKGTTHDEPRPVHGGAGRNEEGCFPRGNHLTRAVEQIRGHQVASGAKIGERKVLDRR